jgi:hypothetical protein
MRLDNGHRSPPTLLAVVVRRARASAQADVARRLLPQAFPGGLPATSGATTRGGR